MYPKQFSERQLTLLNPIAERLSCLSGGEETTVEHKDPRTVDELRTLIYAWLSPAHTNQKSLFRLRRLGPTKLLISRKHSDGVIIRSDSTFVEDFFTKHLIDILNEEEAIEKIRQIEPELSNRIELLRYWRSKQ